MAGAGSVSAARVGVSAAAAPQRSCIVANFYACLAPARSWAAEYVAWRGIFFSGCLCVCSRPACLRAWYTAVFFGFLALDELPQMPAIPGIAVLGEGKAPPGVVPSVAAVDGNSLGALARALAQAVPPPTSPDFALEDGVSVSGKMVAKIQAGQYVELAELLPDNLELLKREVSSFFEWMP